VPAATAIVKPDPKHAKAPPAPQKPILAVSTPAQPAKVTETRIEESVTAQSDAQSQNNVSPALRIVSEESGIAFEELTDTSVFSDMGVDSLLSLLIISRFEDELGIEMGSTVFSDIQTVKELKKFLSPAGSEESIGTAAVDPSDKPVPPVQSTPQVEVTATIPITKLDHAQTIQPTEYSPPTPAVEAQKDVFDFGQPLQIISEESGVAIPDLTDDCIFSDMGVDSLLSLIIVSRFSEELGVDLSSESSMFADYPTVGNLKSFLTGVGQRGIGESALTPASSSHTSLSSLSGESSSEQNIDFVVVTPPTEGSSPPGDSSSKESYVKELRDQPAPTRAATALIIQGRPRTARRTLFLFPDGSGSASSYTNIPAVDSNLAVIGLNCPYRLHPAEMTNCALDDLIDSYVTEIRKHQPSGPYHLGGWSAGGILAYRATQQFISEGEEVHSLVLIDSPVPKGLDRLPQSFYDHCTSVGLFGKGQAKSPPPEWLVPHFNGTIDILHDYWAEPLLEGLTPKTSIIWASESVLDGVKFPKLAPGPDDTEGLKFLTEKRTDFSAAGWEDLFPGDEVRVVRADGADHFSIMVRHNPFCEKKTSASTL
jgi:thioesterase domain-containing protein/acyl carrier protein